jgi:hypothetical protein
VLFAEFEKIRIGHFRVFEIGAHLKCAYFTLVDESRALWVTPRQPPREVEPTMMSL